MTIHIGTLISSGTFLIGLVVAVWRITAAIANHKSEIISKINSLEVKLTAIETDTKHSRDDHDAVVKLATVLEKNCLDVQNQWGKIKEISSDVASVEKDVGEWGSEISKLRRS
jgi:hypothetical protein